MTEGDKQYLEVKIEIKPADRSNFTEFSMDLFDRFQEVRNVYRIENGILVLKNHPFTETWSPERKREKSIRDSFGTIHHLLCV